ncbi:uncharacterized protein Z518_06629 [Rhinocladiella mackenziei CBS 650.93]|uniref:Hypervirulence associated protein TUDOR domain-containing protein n=1 Tax=Rhinocladiella mackenziei CBS 650.93 TaxID=1442369 RepID=A0A0D2IB81_9EURO|nr:uncharacterized protein Z518_06629 [Rhinocladiella mackenziei CBS 650.93]KIX03079.1 hypothetical protein Z518_06629 [Rhinocladiella mackenziei CBS 650.93]
MPSEEPEKGDQVSWNRSGDQPDGVVAEKKTDGEIAINSKRGNTTKENAAPDNPAVHVERSGNDVAKKASEPNVEEKANGSADAGHGETENKNGEKRNHDDMEGGDKQEEAEDKKDGPLEENDEGRTIKAKDSSNKKQKKEQEKKDEPKTEKKKPGRPKKTDGALPKSKKEPTPRATEGIGSRTRSQQKSS